MRAVAIAVGRVLAREIRGGNHAAGEVRVIRVHARVHDADDHARAVGDATQSVHPEPGDAPIRLAPVYLSGKGRERVAVRPDDQIARDAENGFVHGRTSVSRRMASEVVGSSTGPRTTVERPSAATASVTTHGRVVPEGMR